MIHVWREGAGGEGVALNDDKTCIVLELEEEGVKMKGDHLLGS